VSVGGEGQDVDVSQGPKPRGTAPGAALPLGARRLDGGDDQMSAAALRPTSPPAERPSRPRGSASAMVFARSARALQQAARAAGLAVPAFRSPPRRAGSDRTIRRFAAGCVVAVRVHGRPAADVQRDMIEGVVAANQLQGEAAARMRGLLGAALTESSQRPHGVTPHAA
jgi:hypothetical protein